MDVAIRTAAGALIESGSAVKSAETGGWLYTATTTVSAGTSLKFEVTATDRPGHKTTKIENRQ